MSSATSTFITNPGIGERVLLDAPSFARYGFRVERGRSDPGSDGPDPDSNPDLVVLHREERGTPIDDAAAVVIWLEVSERRLAPTVGPFIRTIVRLLDHPIDPRTVRVVVSFDWDLDLDVKARNGDVNKGDHGDKDRVVGRGVAHDVHMIVRNSMGAALFLDLAVLPPLGVDPGAVLRAMDADPDVRYPSVSLMRRDGGRIREALEDGGLGGDDFHGGNVDFFEPRGLPPPPPSGYGPIPTSCLDGFRLDPASSNDRVGRPSCLRLPVRSRMCTVRYAPVAFLIARILLGLPPLPSPPSSPSPTPPRPHETHSRSRRRLFVCIDKPGNLFRVLMLRRDYVGVLPAERGCGGLVIVARDDAMATRLRSEAERFLTESDHSSVALDAIPPPSLEPRDRGATSGVSVLTPEQAAASLRSILSSSSVSSSSSSSSSRPPSVVAFDLADGAATLNGDDEENDALALSALREADATILGFEDDGIPPEMSAQGLGCGDSDEELGGGLCGSGRLAHVQVRARSSLNVVAALSIVLHVAWR